MVSENLIKKVLNIALSTGGDFAEVYKEQDLSDSIVLENGKVTSINTGKTCGIGLRILQGFRSVYGYTNDLSEASMCRLAENLSRSFSGKQEVFVDAFQLKNSADKHQPKLKYSNLDKNQIVDYMKKGDETARAYDNRVIRCEVRYVSDTKDVEIFNSKGFKFVDSRTRGRISVNCVASENGVLETAGERPGALKGFEFFLEEVDIAALAKESAECAVMMLTAKDCPSGKMDVVIGNAFGGVIFHEACGHALEASCVSRDMSVFCGKIGKKVASDIVNAVDDGTIENAWGSGNIDDEGNPTQRTVLIKDGILQSYLIDDFNGRRMNEKGNGATRRESYKFEPTSRMSNTFILNGTSTPEEIIANTKFGLYAKKLGGGSVNPATGEFNFACREAYMIEDGKVTYPVKGATLIGKGSEILFDIDMIGNDLLRDQGMCGAASGSIPTDVGQPTLRVRNITVGGKGGAI